MDNVATALCNAQLTATVDVSSTEQALKMEAAEVEGQFEDAEEQNRGEPRDDHVQQPADVDGGYGESYSSSDEEMGANWDTCDWEDETGDFTKKFNAARRGQVGSNTNAPSVKTRKEPPSQSFQRFENRINLGPVEGRSLTDSATNPLLGASRRAEGSRLRKKDKADRATTEQVLDPRTRMIIFKLLSRGLISEINGCVSTGKEANVYYAASRNGDCAIKVYKTSILVFKDRDKYVTGEFRFRHGYARHNPRKMVRLWAEKEMRNLNRLFANSIPCPQPILLRGHVLVMEFIGKDGWPAPKLKDVHLSEGKARELYLECVHVLRRLYHNCKLVHADLSEYNMLYYEGHLLIIDVSQAVEHDHPQALEFLRKDCANVTEFFRRNKVCVMTVKELFDFVTDITITEANIEEYLERAQERAAERGLGAVSAEDEVSEAVFQQIFIPRKLDEVVTYEQDFEKMQSGHGEDIVYSTVTGLRPDLSGPQMVPQLLQEEGDDGRTATSGKEERTEPSQDAEVTLSATDLTDKRTESVDDDQLCSDAASIELSSPPPRNTKVKEKDDSDSDNDDSESDCSSEDSDSRRSGSSRPSSYHHPRGKEKGDPEMMEQKRAHKQLVREEKRERRKNKVPKHVKRRKEKVGKQKHGK